MMGSADQGSGKAIMLVMRTVYRPRSQ